MIDLAWQNPLKQGSQVPCWRVLGSNQACQVQSNARFSARCPGLRLCQTKRLLRRSLKQVRFSPRKPAGLNLRDLLKARGKCLTFQAKSIHIMYPFHFHSVKAFHSKGQRAHESNSSNSSTDLLPNFAIRERSSCKTSSASTAIAKCTCQTKPTNRHPRANPKKNWRYLAPLGVGHFLFVCVSFVHFLEGSVRSSIFLGVLGHFGLG